MGAVKGELEPYILGESKELCFGHSDFIYLFMYLFLRQGLYFVQSSQTGDPLISDSQVSGLQLVHHDT